VFDTKTSYRYFSLGTKDAYYRDEEKQYIFGLKTSPNKKKGDTSYIHLNHFKNNLMIIKFYPRKLEKSGDYKYRAVINDVNFPKVLATVIRVCEHMVNKHPNASFAFLGSPKEKGGQIEDISATQRYKIYLHALVNRVSSAKFQHIKLAGLSMLCLVNKKHEDPYEYAVSSYNMLCENSQDFRETYGGLFGRD
jgi:hypothetical protein